MPHLDEGQLHALLDGELDQAERQAAEAHLESCSECRREFAEARALMAGADDLIAAVDVPPGTRPAAVAPKARSSGFRWTNVAWAASVFLAVGLGWLARADERLSRAGASAAQPVGDVAAAPALTDSFRAEEKRAPTNGPLAAATGSADRKVARPGATLQRDEAPAAAGGLSAPPAKPESPAQEAAKQRDQAGNTDALRALTNPADKDAEDARQNSAPVATEQGRLALKTEPASQPAPVEERPMAIAQSLPKESATSRFAPAAAAPAGRRDREFGGFRATPMDTAVRILGGSIRLVDGMTPTRVLVGQGAMVSGADPGLEIVRVVYNDPPGRELWLDQQRPEASLNEADGAGKAATTLLPGDTLVVIYKAGQRGLRWIHQSGFRLGLTGFLPADSLRVLARRVQ